MISGFEVRWQLRGQDDESAMERFVVAVERLGDAVTDFDEFIWPRVTKDLEEEERRQFDAEGQGPGRGKWEPLSPAYALQKAQGIADGFASKRAGARLSKALAAEHGWGGLAAWKRALGQNARETQAGAVARAAFGVGTASPILVRTGALREALTERGPKSLRVMTKEKFDFGTRGIEYASFHQVGTTKMPDRPPFDFGTELERDVTESMKDGVREAIRRSRVDEFMTEAP